ncbi:MAG: mycofactocin biosynthesis chaperone MftB [Acidimicrobiales bacterium]
MNSAQNDEELYAKNDSWGVRSEAFGALCYSYETRELLIVRSPYVAKLIDAMDGVCSEKDIIDRVGTEPEDAQSIRRALRRLSESGIIHHVDPA